MNQLLRGLLLLVAAFLLLPAVYGLLKVFMPLIFMLIGVLLIVKLVLGKLPK